MSNQKHPGGRPPKFSSVAALEEKIEDYFKTIEEEGKPPTITGMALHLGFVDRASFYDYKEKDQFSHTMKKARLRIEAAYESNLHGTAPTGSIFALKNFGWRDKQEVQHTGHVAHSDVPLNQEEAETYKQSIEGLYGAVEESADEAGS